MPNYTGRSFYWVMNILDIECVLPIELQLRVENKLAIQFDKENGDECAIIREHINRTFPTSLIENTPPYEYDLIYEDSGAPVNAAEPNRGVAMVRKPRDEKDWRYFVVSYPAGGTYAILFDAVTAFSILKIPLLHGFNYTAHQGGAFSFQANKLAWPYYEYLEKFNTNPDNVDCDDLTRAIQSVPEVLENLSRLRSVNSPIYRVTTNYSGLLSLPYDSDMFTLGLFAILEGLITHKPGGPETKDSLVHQLKNKMSLLNRRFDIPMSYENYFNFPTDIKEVTIWGLLYDYRSLIAHGDRVDFESGKFKQLRNAQSVREFMHLVVRTTLRNALREPDLYLDLSKC